MSIFKIVNQEYSHEQDVTNLYNYICNANKTLGMVNGIAVNEKNAIDEMEFVRKAYSKNNGSLVKHVIISFSPRECIGFNQAYRLAEELVEPISDQFQVVYGVHVSDKAHIHYMINSVSYVDGHQFHLNRNELYDLKNHIDNVTCQEELEKLG